MGHMLKTANPEAAHRIEDERLPLPQVGHMVVYHPRPGEARRGRTKLPAMVLHADVDNRMLDLLVFREADDSNGDERVPEFVEGQRGWSRVPGQDGGSTAIAAMVAGLQSDLAELKQEIGHAILKIFGDYDQPELSLLELLDQVDGRLGAVEDVIKKGEKEAKRAAPAPKAKPTPKAKDAPKLAPEPEAAPRRRFGARR